MTQPSIVSADTVFGWIRECGYERLEAFPGSSLLHWKQMGNGKRQLPKDAPSILTIRQPDFPEGSHEAVKGYDPDAAMDLLQQLIGSLHRERVVQEVIAKVQVPDRRPAPPLKD